MRISVVGGGPAGLYFALLCKQHDPSADVHLYERNSADATFGWGVVFSTQILSRLYTADPETHKDISNLLEFWENVDVVHRNHKVTINGNRFSGIARIDLLRILQRRCARLGVVLHFGAEADSLDRLARESDLLVGADGVNSAVRTKYADYFKPDLSTRPNHYIWYGTHRLFNGLTLTFKQTDAGVFIAHSYKFSPNTSTFIVECDPVTWDRAGLRSISEAGTRRYLASVFAQDLMGQDLLSNNSKWQQFVHVRNKNWYHKNVVLIGDSLHTAHFSIGSGTKLALEDAIALFQSLRAHNSIESGLAYFQSARKPMIDAIQSAAEESMHWFENARDHMSMDPVELAYTTMTRSGRIDYEKLKQRDPAFVARYDAVRLI